MKNDNLGIPRKQGSIGASKILTDRLYHFAAPILKQLMEELDRRLVKTFFDLLAVIILLRHRNHGLLLTELGGQLLGMDQVPAGAKRISNLLHSEGWGGEIAGRLDVGARGSEG